MFTKKLHFYTLLVFRIVAIITLVINTSILPVKVRAVGAGLIIIVDTATDIAVSDTVCSLREAIANANANGIVYSDCGAGDGDDLIEFDSALGAATITLTALLPDLTDTNGLTIDGGGRITISGNTTYRVFYNETGVPLVLTNLTITAGRDNHNGGGSGVMNFGTLLVTNSTFTNNTTTLSYGGGAIRNNGTLTIANSTFSGNASNRGGAIYNNPGGTAVITNSTFFSNHSALFSGQNYGLGGGIYNSGTLTIRNSTFSHNIADNGGGNIFNQNTGTLNQFNTIYANSTGGDCVNNGTLTGNNNLIEDTGANACGLTDGLNGNIIGSDPKLGPETGSPVYFPLLGNSPATNTGDDSVCAASPVNNTAQNGVTRPQGIHCDIGSFEVPVLKLSSSSGTDGWILESAESSNLGGSANSTATTFRLGDDAARRQFRGILSFATGPDLPDNAIITKVTLRIKKQGILGGGNPVTSFQGFVVDIKKGVFGLAALQTADFSAAADKSLGPFEPTAISNWYSLNLTNGKAYINKLNTNGGLTQIRLRFKLDDNNNAAANYLSLYSGNAFATSRPQLIVEYYVP